MSTCNTCKYAGRPPYKSPCSECKEFSQYEYEDSRANADAKLVEQAISHFSYGVSHDIFSEPVTTYAKLAVEALEQQVSKKPYWEYGGWHCKSCGLNVLSDEYFCPVCGQAIDWRDDE